jgi:hypothetical protein
MSLSVAERMPPFWRTPVTVRRSGGRDPKGNPLPGSTHTVPDCLISTQSSADEPQSRSEAPETTAYLYAPAGADFRSTDDIEVPESVPPRLWPSGMFHVSGEPDYTPMGVRVPLRRA